MTTPEVVSADAVTVLRLGEVDSTSLFARRLAQTGQFRRRPAMVVAERQTGGIGRFRRQWISPAGGLWCTLAWPLPASAAADRVLDGLGLRVGIACLDLVSDLLQEARRPIEAQLKWPNDIMVNGRKVAGVLCELVNGSMTPPGDETAAHAGSIGGGIDDRYVLVGVGVNANVSTALLPEELRSKAGGLLDHLARSLDLEVLRSQLQRLLVQALTAEGLPPSLLKRARSHLYGLNQPASVSLPHGQRVFGELVGLNQNGMAVLRTDFGTFVAPSGSILMTE